MNHFKRSGLGILIILKAFWKSTVEIAWGIAGLILVGGMMLQYDVAPSVVLQLLNLNMFLMENWGWFWIAFMILYIYDNYWRLKE